MTFSSGTGPSRLSKSVASSTRVAQFLGFPYRSIILLKPPSGDLGSPPSTNFSSRVSASLPFDAPPLPLHSETLSHTAYTRTYVGPTCDHLRHPDVQNTVHRCDNTHGPSTFDVARGSTPCRIAYRIPGSSSCALSCGGFGVPMKCGKSDHRDCRNSGV